MTNSTHADLEIRIGERREAGYPVELSLNNQRMFRGGYISPEVANWTPPRLDAEAGRELFSMLVQDDLVRGAWNMVRGASPQRRIRLSIDSTAPELYKIPWELMQEVGDGGIGVSLAASDATPFSRFIALPQAYGEPLRAYPLRIVVAVASPSNLKDYPGGLVEIDADREWDSIQSELEGLPVELIRIPQPCTLEAIDDALSNGAHALHLIAHGTLSRQGRAVILLANRNNQVRHVYADEDATLLALHARDTDSRPDALRLIFLASCQSATADPTDAFRSFAPRLVQAGVPAVVAMQDLVPVDTARAFTKAFYRQLMRHGEVDLATNQARASLLAGQWPAAHVPVLFMRLTDGQLLASNPARTALENTLADARFAFFDPIDGDYVPLPVEAVHVTGHQDVAQFQGADGESTASIDIWDAVEEVLTDHVPHDGHTVERRVLALLGGYGSNRGTQLKRIVWNTARLSLEGSNGAFVLPVFVDLKSKSNTALADPESIEKLVIESLNEVWPGTRVNIQQLLAGQEPVLRFVFNTDDSLPEREQAAWIDRVRLFINRHPQHQYVVGANLEAFDDRWFAGLDQHLLILQPMVRRRIRHFLQHLPADDPGGLPLLERLDRYGIYDLAAVPWFMVKLLEHARAGTYPESRTQMLGKIVDDAVSGVVDRLAAGSLSPTLNRQGLHRHVDQILNALAWRLQTARMRELSLADAFEIMKQVRGDREYSLERMVEALIDKRLLTTYGVDSLRFAYSLIQAYCCAREIIARPDREASLDDITSTLGRLSRLHWWEETLVFSAGILAGDINAVAPFLEIMVYGMNLLESERTFLAARCLSEAASQPPPPEIASLNDTVTSALIWRLQSGNEPNSTQRSRAAELLGQIASPSAVEQLASTAYFQTRLDRRGGSAYDYSNVRMAAIIGLLRMSETDQEELLAGIDLVLSELLYLWQSRDVPLLIEWLDQNVNTSAQGLAAMALGDLHMQLKLSPEDQPAAKQAIDALACKFLTGEMDEATHWAVAYALATVDLPTVRQAVLIPFVTNLDGLLRPAEEGLQQLKCLAYLIGLVRWQDQQARTFLLERCIRDTTDANLIAVAIDSLARLADTRDRPLMEAIALGRPPAEAAPSFAGLSAYNQNYLRRKAIEALTSLGNEASLANLRQHRGDRAGWNQELEQALYRTSEEIFWRQYRDDGLTLRGKS